LLAENEILKEQLDTKGQKLKLSNHQRRKLAKQGKRLGRKRLKEYANIATPGTILRWHRTLIALKYTAKRKINTERQERMVIIRELCVKFANENRLLCLRQSRDPLGDLKSFRRRPSFYLLWLQVEEFI
jgi:hypothetical protein